MPGGARRSSLALIYPRGRPQRRKEAGSTFFNSPLTVQSLKEIYVRVLLVEDDSGTAQSIELMLKTESINVYRTDLGEEEIDLGKIYDYDIILLDLNLPDISGYEVLRSLRSAKISTPILALAPVL